MALTRKMLKAMGIEEEKIDQIIEAHAETVDGLKTDINRYKGDAEKLPGVQKELDALKAKGDDGWKDKHDSVKKEFDKYKEAVEAKETQTAKEKAYRDVLKDAGLNDKGIEKAVKYADWSKVELADDGKIKNASDHINTAKEEWSEYVATTTTTGATTVTPPVTTTTGGPDLGSMSMADYIAARKKK